MPFAVGETVGLYQIVEQLGQGGMATVFKAYHPALDRYIAIKALHPAFTIEPNFLTRFRREAQVIVKLEHPNIVPVYDFAEHEGRPYLVLKFIEGDTLKARMNRAPLEPSEISRIVESIGAALDYAHRLRSRVNRMVASRGSPTQAQPAEPGAAALPARTPAPPSGGQASGSPGQPPPIHAISVEEAQSRVAAEPDNPEVYLDLAVAYWDQNMHAEAVDAYSAALEHAGNDAEFYLRAGDIALERQLWSEAARMYIDAARMMREPGPPEFQEKLRQALYLASGGPSTDELLNDMPGGRISPDLVAVLQARQALKQGQIVRAKAMARRLSERQPSLGELRLLEAEILVAEGQDERARSELEVFVSDPATPQWICLVSDYILSESISGE